MSVIIQNDGLDTADEHDLPDDLERLEPAQLKNIVLEAGIVGLGGAAFPTHVKLSPPADKKIDTVILNGAECEPYLTSDYRLMIESPDQIISGLKLVMKILGVSNGFIGIEDNKQKALRTVKKAAAGEKNIKVVALKTKYPQGAEKQLIHAVTGWMVPSGGLPMDVGVVVNNVGTAAAIHRAVTLGEPLYQRIVTVSGSAVREPKNLLVRIGTSFRDVIDICGGLTEEPVKVISGGPMMGIAQHNLDVPVVKGTSGILVLSKKEAELPEPSACIRCGKCVEVCPINLLPLNLSNASLKGNMEDAESLHAMDCIECGSCSYICPAKRPLLHSIRIAKKEITARRKRSATS